MIDSESRVEARKGYLVTDDEREAVGALEEAAGYLEIAEIDPARAWKWVIIALHNAVQGFMVLALKSTWNVRVLHRDQRSEKIRAESDYRQATEDGDEAAAASFSMMLGPEGDLAAFLHL